MYRLRKSARFAIVCVMLYVCSCHPPGKGTIPTGPVTGINDTVSEWLNWVAVFRSDVDSFRRASYIDSFRNQLLLVRSDYPVSASDSVDRPYLYYLSRYLRNSIAHPFQISNVVVQPCNCPDTLLWNVKADLNQALTDTAGPSTPTSPKPGSGTTVSGGMLESIVKNDSISTPANNSAFINASAPLSIRPGYRMSPAVIAVIDTGIDTLLLDENLRRDVLWNGATGPINLLLGSNINDYTDDHAIRHGTSVASVALNAFYRESGDSHLPKLMVLKAADSLGRGTLFEYGCALAFAIRNQATVINSSMGFYGEDNDMVKFLLRKARQDSIPVIAAAGNGSEAHTDPLCRSNVNSANMLQEPARMYYPAVLAANMEQFTVISVTGVSEAGRPCYFQNYSESFVTLGVLNQSAETNCCSYRLPFIADQRAVEGSSFATPVVSGRIAFQASQHGRRLNVRDYLAMLGNVVAAPVIDAGPVTQGNQYISY